MTDAAPTARPALLSITLAETERLFDEWGFLPAHARTLRHAVLDGRDPMATPRVPHALLERVDATLRWLGTESVRQEPADDGSTKHLIRLEDGALVETVHLPGSPGGAPSACVSSQVGCAMACRFCASGLDKVARNLLPHELLEQIAHLRRSGPVRRLVFMGSGEPTQNLRNLAVAMDVLQAEGGIGPRKMLVSTVGPASAVDRLTAMGRRFTLALSLHASTPEQRASLIPTQHKQRPDALLDAADRFSAATRTPYQVEYVLLGGENDAPEDAERLAALLDGRRAHVSVIAWNCVPGMPFESPSQSRAEAFVETLRAGGASATLRRTVGGEATAACGQLRASAG